MNLELRKFFDTTLKQELRDLESMREWCVLFAALGIIATFVAVITALYYKGLAILLTAIPLGLAGLLFFKAYEIWNEYIAFFRQNVVGYLVLFVNPDWEYLPMSKISKDIYEESSFFNYRIDEYQGNNLIRSTIDDISFECSMLNILHDTGEYDDEGQRGKIGFTGLFFCIDLQQHSSEKTLILPNSRWIKEEDYKVPLIQMEQPDFERVFDVYSTSLTEARHILTPKMMETMLSLKRKYNKGIRFSFTGSRVYCEIYFAENSFNPRMLRSSVEFDDMVAIHDSIKMIEDIILELKRNIENLDLLDSEILDEKVQINVEREE